MYVDVDTTLLKCFSILENGKVTLMTFENDVLVSKSVNGVPQQMTANYTTASSEEYRVAVHLQPFWPDRPALWFAQAEAQFQLAAITCQQTKFNYVVSQLNQQQAAEVEDIIIQPPEHEPYDLLKAELVRQLSTSREQRMRQLLSYEQMGDQKPSQFLQHLRSLAPDVPDDFLRTIWASRLPRHVQGILDGWTEGSLDSASHLADKILEAIPQPATASMSTAAPDNTAVLLERIEELSRRVSSLQTSSTQSHSQSRDCIARPPETTAPAPPTTP
jgi:hypothetical protein